MAIMRRPIFGGKLNGLMYPPPHLINVWDNIENSSPSDSIQLENKGVFL